MLHHYNDLPRYSALENVRVIAIIIVVIKECYSKNPADADYLRIAAGETWPAAGVLHCEQHDASVDDADASAHDAAAAHETASVHSCEHSRDAGGENCQSQGQSRTAACRSPQMHCRN